MEDYYKILSVEPTASQAEIEQAANRLSSVWREKSKLRELSSSEQSILHRIQKASNILTDPVKRLQYDVKFGLKKNFSGQTQQKGNTVIPLKVSMSIERLPTIKIPTELDFARLEKLLAVSEEVPRVTTPIENESYPHSYPKIEQSVTRSPVDLFVEPQDFDKKPQFTKAFSENINTKKQLSKEKNSDFPRRRTVPYLDQLYSQRQTSPTDLLITGSQNQSSNESSWKTLHILKDRTVKAIEEIASIDLNLPSFKTLDKSMMTTITKQNDAKLTYETESNNTATEEKLPSLNRNDSMEADNEANSNITADIPGSQAKKLDLQSSRKSHPVDKTFNEEQIQQHSVEKQKYNLSSSDVVPVNEESVSSKDTLSTVAEDSILDYSKDKIQDFFEELQKLKNIKVALAKELHSESDTVLIRRALISDTRKIVSEKSLSKILQSFTGSLEEIQNRYDELKKISLKNEKIKSEQRLSSDSKVSITSRKESALSKEYDHKYPSSSSSNNTIKSRSSSEQLQNYLEELEKLTSDIKIMLDRKIRSCNGNSEKRALISDIKETKSEKDFAKGSSDFKDFLKDMNDSKELVLAAKAMVPSTCQRSSEESAKAQRRDLLKPDFEKDFKDSEIRRSTTEPIFPVGVKSEKISSLIKTTKGTKSEDSYLIADYTVKSKESEQILEPDKKSSGMQKSMNGSEELGKLRRDMKIMLDRQIRSSNGISEKRALISDIKETKSEKDFAKGSSDFKDFLKDMNDRKELVFSAKTMVPSTCQHSLEGLANAQRLDLSKPALEKDFKDSEIRRSMTEPIFPVGVKSEKISSLIKTTKGTKSEDSYLMADYTVKSIESEQISEPDKKISGMQRSTNGSEKLSFLKQFLPSEKSAKVVEPTKSNANYVVNGLYDTMITATEIREENGQKSEQLLARQETSTEKDKRLQTGANYIRADRESQEHGKREIQHIDSYDLIKSRLPQRMTAPELFVPYDHKLQDQPTLGSPLQQLSKSHSERLFRAMKLLENLENIDKGRKSLSKQSLLKDTKDDPKTIKKDDSKVTFSDTKHVFMRDEKIIELPVELKSDDTNMMILEVAGLLINDFTQKNSASDFSTPTGEQKDKTLTSNYQPSSIPPETEQQNGKNEIDAGEGTTADYIATNKESQENGKSEIQHSDSYELIKRRLSQRMTAPELYVPYDHQLQNQPTQSLPLPQLDKYGSERLLTAMKLLKNLENMATDRESLSVDSLIKEAKDDPTVISKDDSNVTFSDTKQVFMREEKVLELPMELKSEDMEILEEARLLIHDFMQNVSTPDLNTLSVVQNDKPLISTYQPSSIHAKTEQLNEKHEIDAGNDKSLEVLVDTEQKSSSEESPESPFPKQLQKVEKKIVLKDWRESCPELFPMPIKVKDEPRPSQSVSACTRIAGTDLKTVYHFGPDTEFIEVFVDDDLRAKIVKDQQQDVYWNTMKHDDLPPGVNVCASTVIAANDCVITTEIARRGKRQSIAVYKNDVLLCRTGNTVLDEKEDE